MLGQLACLLSAPFSPPSPPTLTRHLTSSPQPTLQPPQSSLPFQLPLPPATSAPPTHSTGLPTLQAAYPSVDKTRPTARPQLHLLLTTECAISARFLSGSCLLFCSTRLPPRLACLKFRAHLDDSRQCLPGALSLAREVGPLAGYISVNPPTSYTIEQTPSNDPPASPLTLSTILLASQPPPPFPFRSLPLLLRITTAFLTAVSASRALANLLPLDTG